MLVEPFLVGAGAPRDRSFKDAAGYSSYNVEMTGSLVEEGAIFLAVSSEL